ncbi:MAG: family 16 glycosylhydrolase [Pseudomonadota bacterium]
MFKITSSILAGALCLFAFTAIEVSAKPYKGAEIYNASATKYGRYVMRMKMAKGSGVLSTYFTYKDGSEIAGTFWEEIDIEVLGKNDAFQMQSNIIIGNGTHQTTEGLHSIGASLADAYHTYTLEWTPDYVAWFIDGQEMRRINGGNFVSSLTNPQSMRFNIWASTSEPWVGAFNPTILPVYQFVNYMEYHSYNTSSRTFSLAWRDDFNSFDTSRWAKANWTFEGNYVDFDPANVVVQSGTLVLALTTENNKGFSGTVPADNAGNSSSMRSSSSSIRSSAVASSIARSVANSIASSRRSSTPMVASSSSLNNSGTQQCNWYGSLYPLCVNTTSGWGYENNKSCISRSTCAGQPAPFGIVGGTNPSSVAASSRSPAVSSVASSSSVAASVAASVAFTSSSSVATGGLTCSVKVTNNWGNGYQLDVTVKNGTSATVNGWDVILTFTENPLRTGGWNAVFGGSGYLVSAGNVNWNGTLAPNQSVSFGFQGNHDGSFVVPSCKVTGISLR